MREPRPEGAHRGLTPEVLTGLGIGRAGRARRAARRCARGRGGDAHRRERSCSGVSECLGDERLPRRTASNITFFVAEDGKEVGGGAGDGGHSCRARTDGGCPRVAQGAQRVRLVRGEGRGVSDQYEGPVRGAPAARPPRARSPCRPAWRGRGQAHRRVSGEGGGGTVGMLMYRISSNTIGFHAPNTIESRLCSALHGAGGDCVRSMKDCVRCTAPEVIVFGA